MIQPPPNKVEASALFVSLLPVSCVYLPVVLSIEGGVQHSVVYAIHLDRTNIEDMRPASRSVSADAIVYTLVCVYPAEEYISVIFTCTRVKEIAGDRSAASGGTKPGKKT